MIEIQVQGLRELDAYLSALYGDMRDNLRAAVEVSAKNVKDAARQRLKPISGRGKSHIPFLPTAIKYTWLRGPRSTIEASVHATGKQARLIGVIEHGSPTSAPHPALGPAGTEEWDGFREGVRTAIREAIGRGNG
jgi:hypothetical protein